MEVLPLSSGKNRKEILLQLVMLYNNLDRFGVSGADLKGLKWIEMLETNHSLSQKEGWQLNEVKALLLNEVGNQDEFLPIWYKLLEQYRAKEMLTADFKDKRNCFNTSEGSIIPLLFPI